MHRACLFGAGTLAAADDVQVMQVIPAETHAGAHRFGYLYEVDLGASIVVHGDTVAAATSYHKNVGKFIVIALVVLHVAAILFYKWFKQDGLVRPMVVGDKQLAAGLVVPHARDSAVSRLLALAVLAVCGWAVAWLVQLGNAF